MSTVGVAFRARWQARRDLRHRALPRHLAGGEVVANRGSVTAEMAVALPVLVFVVGAGMWLIAALLAQTRCIDAAREAARAMARGDDRASAEAVARRVAPPGSSLDIRVIGREVTVTVRNVVRPGGGLPARLVPVRVSATATTDMEPAR